MLIAGVDEVGRGPLAGPVVTAAVILDPARPIDGLTDSKKLSEKRREASWALGRAEVEEIDQLNILQASLLAMRRAVLALAVQPEKVHVDGIHAPDLPYPVLSIIKGDLNDQAIAAASILAKVARDLEMAELDKQYPGYDLGKHKGYPTVAHQQALMLLGASPVHRKSFKPVQLALLGR